MTISIWIIGNLWPFFAYSEQDGHVKWRKSSIFDQPWRLTGAKKVTFRGSRGQKGPKIGFSQAGSRGGLKGAPKRGQKGAKMAKKGAKWPKRPKKAKKGPKMAKNGQKSGFSGPEAKRGQKPPFLADTWDAFFLANLVQTGVKKGVQNIDFIEKKTVLQPSF